MVRSTSSDTAHVYRRGHPGVTRISSGDLRDLAQRMSYAPAGASSPRPADVARPVGPDHQTRADPNTSARLDRAVATLPVRLAEVLLQDLADGTARQGVDDVDGLRALVRRQPLARERDDLLFGGLALQCDNGFHRFTPLLVGHADDGDLGDRGMLGQYPLDLDRVDVLAAGDDHVLEPVLDEDVAALIDPADVTAPKPTVLGDRLGGR